MSSGMHWFRWYHGSVTNPKFQVVARQAGVTLTEVISVWAYVLEQASASAERGYAGEQDCEAIDCLFGFPDGRTQSILQAMQARSLLDGDLQVLAWTKRQPKREDETANERKRRQRQLKHQVDVANVTNGVSRDVTQSHADVPQVTPDVTLGHSRGEERRVEEKKKYIPNLKVRAVQEPPSARDLVFANGVTLLTAAGVKESSARSFLAAQCKNHGESALLEALYRCAAERPVQPVPWLQALLGPTGPPTKGKPRKSDALMAGNIAAAQRYLEGQPND